RAFAPKPELLLLDEPFAALDPPSREMLVADLREAIRATGTTCAVVTHDRSEAMALADRLGVIVGARLAQAGPTEEVLSHPATEAVARFVGVENIVPVRVAGCAGGLLRLEADGVVLLARHAPVEAGSALALIRAEDVRLMPPGEMSPGSVLCTVESLAPGLGGNELRLAPVGLRARLPRGNDLALRPGDQVACAIAPERIGLVTR
ncbi:MAG: Fe3+/spermidine/putrescine ABC transporter ATP-binding protein, partial [Myxococcales bacterium]